MRFVSILTLIFAFAAIFTGSPADFSNLNVVEAEVTEADHALQSTSGAPVIVDITAIGLEYAGPSEVPSGWTTFRFHNAASMTHFATINRMPEGRGVADHQEEVAPVFQEGMDLLNQGEVDAAMAAFGQLPDWFSEVVLMGGPGFVGPGLTGQTTVYLEPGTYMLECYVKTGSIFHSYNPDPDMYGMVHEFTVTEETTEAAAPQPTLEVAVSSERGIEVGSEVRAGYHTVAVLFEDQTVYGHFLGHDVQLVRLQDDTDMDALAGWMDWTQPNGLETPAPAEFIGGIQDMPAGETGYFSVVLSPGRYAWIAEVPDPAGKNMLQTFTVGPASNTGS